MNFKLLLVFGTILLIIGLFTIMLPEFLSHINIKYEEKVHDYEGIIFPSTIYGFLITAIGLFCMEYTSKKKKNTGNAKAKRQN